jgi:hypothetical protein
MDYITKSCLFGSWKLEFTLRVTSGINMEENLYEVMGIEQALRQRSAHYRPDAHIEFYRISQSITLPELCSWPKPIHYEDFHCNRLVCLSKCMCMCVCVCVCVCLWVYGCVIKSFSALLSSSCFRLIDLSERQLNSLTKRHLKPSSDLWKIKHNLWTDKWNIHDLSKLLSSCDA